MSTHPATYHLCPRCGRAVTSSTRELFCINDGSRMLEHCVHCGATITSPHAEYCAMCGQAYTWEHPPYALPS